MATRRTANAERKTFLLSLKHFSFYRRPSCKPAGERKRLIPARGWPELPSDCVTARYPIHDWTTPKETVIASNPATG
jgi:hypothetical protein